jgi:hypothetical protein
VTTATPILVDLFPAAVATPDATYDNARILATDTYLWLFTVSGGTPRFLQGVTLVDFDADNAARRGAWTAVDDQGREWQVMQTGGCGCGNPLRRYTADALLALVP